MTVTGLAHRPIRVSRKRGPRVVGPSPLFYTAVAALFLLFGFGPNMALAAFACVVLTAGVVLLWRPGEPPILLMLFSYQWLQCAIGPFWGNAVGRSIESLFRFNGQQSAAAALALTAVLCLAIGMRLGAGPPGAGASDLAKSAVHQQSMRRWLMLYVVTSVASIAAQFLSRLVPGLSQVFEGITGLRWAGFFIFTYATFSRQRTSKLLWLAAFAFEFFQSLGGYFSTFKEVFFYTAFALIAAKPKISPGAVIAGVIIAVPLGYFALAWTAVKSDYRNYVSGGEKAQIITVGYGDRISRMFTLVTNLDTPSLGNAAVNLVSRLSYTEYFGVSLDFVPQSAPHSNGSIWMDALSPTADAAHPLSGESDHR